MIKKIEISEIPGRSYIKSSKLQAELQEFIKSDWPACEVATGNYVSAKSALNAYRVAIKRAHLGISIIIRNGRVFLIKEAQ